MSEWKDQSSFAQGDKARVPNTYRRKAGVFTLAIHRHIHYPPDVWLFSCSSVADKHELKAKDISAAKQEADALFWLRLHEAIKA